MSVHNLGEELYKKNDNYKYLVNLMEHPEFRAFYEQNFEDIESIKTFVMFMKIYEGVEKYSKVVLTPYEKLAIVDDVMHDSDKRRKICNGIQEWFKQNNSIVLPKLN